MVSLGLIVFLGTSALLLGLGLRGYLTPAAKEAGVVISDLRTLREKWPSEKADKKKGERE